MDVRKRKPIIKIPVTLTQILKISSISIFLTLTLLVINRIHFSQYFPIRSVKIYGVNHVDPLELQHLISPHLKTGFFSLNVEYIRDRLLQLPWVSDLFVKRVWPDGVEIVLTERNAVAKWNEESLLSDAGALFQPSLKSIPTQLPHFRGPQGQQMMIFQNYQKINRLFLPLNVKVSSLELTPYYTWRLVLDNGIIMQIGYKDVLTQLAQFVKVYDKIVSNQEARVEYIDLRYSNGVAVKWKDVRSKA